MGSCDMCSRSFDRRSTLLSHKEDKHSLLSLDTSWTCDIGLCRRSFVRESSLWIHKETNAHVKKPKKAKRKQKKKKRRHKCDVCSKGFPTKRERKKHMRAKHSSGDKTTSYESDSDDTDSDSSSDIEDFLESCKPPDVHRYISHHLQPDEAYRDECSSVVEHLANFFKTNSGFTVNRFIKGGSVGKGTAIKSKSDVDLVMFISELPPIGSEIQQLDKLESTLVKSKHSIAYDLAVVGRTGHAVKLRVQSKKADREPHYVDLLLASDLMGPAPTDTKKKEVYGKMGSMNEHARENCSAALVELQRDFVKSQPADVKDLIRLVKMWKKSRAPVSQLKSYSLELLCIHVGQSSLFPRNVASAFESVLRKLIDHKNINAYWNYNYPISVVPKKLVKKRPLILDPANPYNNVVKYCKPRHWRRVANAAKKTLKKAFFT